MELCELYGRRRWWYEPRITVKQRVQEKGVVTGCDGDGDSDMALVLLAALEWSWWFTTAGGGCQLVTLREGDENSSLMVSFMG
ncbi:hypothetical protein L1987_87540 [Smallanthus sonchifolius]|nr:hypothetical protein L1987_87540 [Smallanthus sonchifolius]